MKALVKFIHRHIWTRIVMVCVCLIVTVLSLISPLRVVEWLTGESFHWDDES